MPDASGGPAPAKPGDVTGPDPRSIAHEVVRVLTVPRGPRRFVRASVPLVAATQGQGQPILGGPGRIRDLSFCFDSLVTVGGSGGVGLLTLMDGNNQMVYQQPIAIATGAVAPIPPWRAGSIDYGFAGGLLAQWAIVAGSFTAGSIAVLATYDSIPIGQQVSDGLGQH